MEVWHRNAKRRRQVPSLSFWDEGMCNASSHFGAHPDACCLVVRVGKKRMMVSIGMLNVFAPASLVPAVDGIPLRVHVPNNKIFGFWVIVIIVQVLGRYMVIEYLDR